MRDIPVVNDHSFLNGFELRLFYLDAEISLCVITAVISNGHFVICYLKYVVYITGSESWKWR